MLFGRMVDSERGGASRGESDAVAHRPYVCGMEDNMQLLRGHKQMLSAQCDAGKEATRAKKGGGFPRHSRRWLAE